MWKSTAAGAFLSQLYGGVENIMKRISKFHGVPLPVGDAWHADLFRSFCHPPEMGLPELFDEAMEDALSGHRRFRHWFVHGYGVLLDWDRVREGAQDAPCIYKRAITSIRQRLNVQPSDEVSD